MTIISAASKIFNTCKSLAVIVKYSQGMKWKPACEEVGIDPRTVKNIGKNNLNYKNFILILLKNQQLKAKTKSLSISK